MRALPVRVEQRREAPIGEAEHLHADVVVAEEAHRRPQLFEPPLAIGEIRRGPGHQLTRRMLHRLDIPIARGEHHEARSTAAREHALQQPGCAEGFVVRMGRDDE
jgi:hypothetical protein